MKKFWIFALVISFIPLAILEVINIPIAGIRYCFGNKTIFQKTPLHVWRDLKDSLKEF